jgi:enoyl-CoA hydratase
MPYSTLELSLRPPFADVTLRRDIADTARLLDEMDAAAAAIAGADDVHVAMLTIPAGSRVQGAADAGGRLAFRSLELMPQPVIAIIEGSVEGALLELALACDLRVAAEGASFSIATAREGSAITLGGTQRLPRLVGRARASQMILLGESVDAQTALAWGLVNAVAADGEAQKRAEEIASSIAGRGPLAVRYAKEAIAQGLDMTLEQALRYETDLTVILQTTDDRAEGVRAFLEKRAPKFGGR